MSSPQFKKRSHRAKDRFATANQQFTWAFEACDKSRAENKTTKPYIFAPSGTEDFLIQGLKKVGFYNQFLNLDFELKSLLMASAMMWSAWRITKGIYSFEPSLYKKLVNKKDDKSIPIGVIKKLPQWCVYIETPDLKSLFDDEKEHEVFGFWAMFVEATDGSNKDILLLFADIYKDGLDDSMPPAIQIDASEDEIKDGLKLGSEAQKIGDWVMPAIRLLTHLCNDGQLSSKRKPENPAPKKTKDGWKLFEARGSSHFIIK